jgi:hypothetical protein
VALFCRGVLVIAGVGDDGDGISVGVTVFVGEAMAVLLADGVNDAKAITIEGVPVGCARLIVWQEDNR